MTAHHQYHKSPLVEAVLDIRVSASPDGMADRLAAVWDAERERYPTRLNRYEVETPIQFVIEDGDSSQPPDKRTWIGYRCASADGKRLFHAQTNGFAYNRLASYTGWIDFQEEARRLWKAYVEFVRPEVITRVALRYINRFDLAVDTEFSDFFRTYPEVSKDLPQGLIGMGMYLVIPQVDIEATLVLNQSMLPPQENQVIPIILDLDLFQLFQTERMSPESDRLWESVARLHDRQYDIFEACITDRAREFID